MTDDGAMQASTVGGPPPREGAHDATTAALDRLAALHRPYTHQSGHIICADIECCEDWPCDTALAVRLARRATEWIGVNPSLGVGGYRCEDCGQWSADNVIGITRDLHDPKQHEPSCEWAELAAMAATPDDDTAADGREGGA